MVNHASNSNGFLPRKDANYYLLTGRAKWVDEQSQTQVRLIENHPRNVAAREKAAKGYNEDAAAANWRGSRRSNSGFYGPGEVRS